MKYRGLHDDLSRGPVPTLEFQKKLIRTLAAYKVNLYSPYFEHTAATRRPPHRAPRRNHHPGPGRRARRLRRPYHVTIIPEQEAFGHLHYLLNWEQYAPRRDPPRRTSSPPASPTPSISPPRMFNELAAIYPGPFLHLGADETVELGKGQTKAAVDAQGLGPVYLDFMQKIVTDLQPLHRKLLFWGDIATDAPDLLKAPALLQRRHHRRRLGVQPPAQRLHKFITPFTDAGFETWVSPGINNCRGLSQQQRPPNIQQFTRDGQKLGATGQLNTIWNDDGEGLANNNWYGILFGAEAAWHQGESSIPEFQQSYAQVFHGDATGKINQAQIEMMAAHALLKDPTQVRRQQLLFWHDPFSKDGQRIAGQIRPFTHDLRLHAERALTLIAVGQSRRRPQAHRRQRNQPEADLRHLLRLRPLRRRHQPLANPTPSTPSN